MPFIIVCFFDLYIINRSNLIQRVKVVELLRESGQSLSGEEDVRTGIETMEGSVDETS